MRSAKEQSMIGEAVRHPLRVRILEVLNEQDMTPSEFLNAGCADFYFARRPPVSHIAYHFRELAEHGCLEEIAWRKSRGSVATTYRGVARAAFVDEDWTELSDEEKRFISKTVAQGLIARIDGALMAETFNSRDDRQLSWFAMQVDERGWTEVAEVLAEAFHAVSRIREDAAARLVESGEKGMTATAGIMVFESPEPTPPAERGSS
ncbi:MAG TPA: hypothetical protein VGH14_06540 [Solirubrobacterales bacterium]|jgi:hypothetical protein